MQDHSFPEKRSREKKLVLVETTVHGKRRWRLNGYYLNGVRTRKFFLKKVDGLKFIEDLKRTSKELGERAATVPGWLHEQAVEAHRILAPHNMSILEAAEAMALQLDRRGRSITFKKAAEHFLASMKKKGRSNPHLLDVKSRTGRFAKKFGETLMSDISTGDVDRWLDSIKLSPLSINNFRSALNNIFQFAVARGWAESNPVAGIQKVKVVSKVPDIFSVADLRRLLDHAGEEEIPYIAIGAFAGLRSAELGHLTWEDIKMEEKLIVVRAAASKTASRRLVTIHANLQAWLAPYKDRKGSILPANFRKRMDACSRKAGFGLPGSETEEERMAGLKLVSWPPNGLRHSFGSYHLAMWKDAAKTALEMGHTTTKVLFQNYREVVRPADAVEYWNLSPNPLS